MTPYKSIWALLDKCRMTLSQCYTLDVSFTVEVGVTHKGKGRRARARFERKVR